MSALAYQYDDVPGYADEDADAAAHPDAVPYAVSFLRAHPVPRPPRRRRGRLVLMLASAAVLGGAVYGVRAPQESAPVAPTAAAVVRQAALIVPAEPARGHGWLLDPRPVLGSDAYGLNAGAPLAPTLRAPLAQAEAVPERSATQTLAEAAPAQPAPSPVAAPLIASLVVPLPVPRPAALQPATRMALQTPRPVGTRALPSTRSVFQAARREEPSFFESIFGGGPSEGGAERQALAYAGTEGEGIALSPRRRLGPVPNPSEGVAVYDITAGSVTLPSGERLEAHSGLGEAMDNPRYVHVRMRGATPPGTYELTEREALFHGVRALRLNPVGGPGAIYGRVGLLTHTYMLGPKGASNGCISFRDYNRFLQAYLRGEIRRVVVVAGNGDAPPAIGNNRIGQDRLGMGARARRSDDG